MEKSLQSPPIAPARIQKPTQLKYRQYPFYYHGDLHPLPKFYDVYVNQLVHAKNK